MGCVLNRKDLPGLLGEIVSSTLWQPLGELAIRIHEAAHEEDVFRTAGDGLKTLGFRSAIALLDSALERFRLVYASTARPVLIVAERLFGARGIGYEIAIGESFTLGQAVHNRATVYVRDALSYAGAPDIRPRTIKRGIELLDAAPHIAAPLIARDRVLGAIAVQSSRLAEEDGPAVMAFAGHLALAVDALRRQAEAASRERQLAIIVQINQNVSADLTNVARAYDSVLHEIKRLVSFDEAEVALIEPESRQVRISSPGTTLPGEDSGASTYTLRGSVIEWMMTYGQPYVAKDTNVDREFAEARTASARRMRSLIALPMRHRGQVLGAFILLNRTPYFYAESDCDRLAPIVDQMASTLVNYRLFEQVERGRRQLQAVLDSTGDAVIAADMSGRITLMNPAAVRLFGFEDSAEAGRPVWDVVKVPGLAEAFRQALAGKFSAPLGLEVPLLSDRVLFADLTPIHDMRAHALGWMAVIRDITHHKQMEALRSETIATAAHDMKSPLHLIAGALGVLAEDAPLLAEEQREAIEIAQSGLRRMRRLIDDILDLKKIEDGFGIDKRECDLSGVLRSVADEATASAAARSQELVLDMPRELPVIRADPDRLHQVFANLVSNAIKYTQSGGAIRIRALASGDLVRVTVIDNGSGISVEDQARIFEKFYRTRSSSKIDGTGLGLAIVKSIVEQHGGHVIVQSTPGQGSEFVVSLPVTSD